MELGQRVVLGSLHSRSFYLFINDNIKKIQNYKFGILLTGWINRLLSWEAFEPLSRLTYNAYLVHTTFALYMMANDRFTASASDLMLVTRLVLEWITCRLGGLSKFLFSYQSSLRLILNECINVFQTFDFFLNSRYYDQDHDRILTLVFYIGCHLISFAFISGD